jgi:hypothetical protein
MFIIICDCASIASIVSKWRPVSFIFNRGNREHSQGQKSGEWGGWGTTVMLLLVKSSLVKMEV